MSAAQEPRPVPLGDLYRGTCHDSYTPSDTELRQWCNFGYARNHCAHFPADAGPDAVRFAIASEGPAISVHFVLERDHRPFAHGTFQPPHPDPMVDRLASAYIAAYERRKT
jgi:hypothetical protein